jgi:threonylcarbamoyladenosine tRNA methylthiotransferase MtaB
MVKIITMGCRVNSCESEEIEKLMSYVTDEQIEYVSRQTLLTENTEQPNITERQPCAGVTIVNSCAVTEKSENKLRKLVANSKKSGLVIVTGCAVRAFSGKTYGADFAVGNYKDIPKLFTETAAAETVPDRLSGFTRAFLKIEDGCDGNCAYCIIPAARGNVVKSVPVAEIKEKAEHLVKAGHKEIVLVGINMLRYGSDTGESFCGAVKAVCDTAVERVRISSLEPRYLTVETIKFLARQNKVCPDFHLSLQSGCNTVLQRMNRNYTSEQFYKTCKILHHYFRSPAISTDIIVGFPEETDGEFQTTLEFIKKCRFSKVHLFTYSRRPGTAACAMLQIPEKVKRERYVRAEKICNEVREWFISEQTGTVQTIITEKRTNPEFICGHTNNGLYVTVRDSELERNQIVKVNVVKGNDGELEALLIRN